MEWTTTTTILNGLRDYGNDDAWQRFVVRFRRPLLHFARSVGMSGSDAEDVAQDALMAFAEAHREGRYDQDKGRLSQWLFGITFNHIRRHRQKEARRGAKLIDVGGGTAFWQELPDQHDAGHTWEREWELALWTECVERVQSEFETTTLRAFELTVREDKSASQAAQLMGVPVKTVYNAKHRVLKRIRELREQYEQIT